MEILQDGEFLTEVNDGLRLIQKRGGLTFGTDALLLAAFTEKRGKNHIACELGAGTGIVSLLVAGRKGFSRIYSVEVQPQFAELIGRNVSLNGFDGIIEPICADLRDVDIKCDVAFANPPYMKAGSGFENRETMKNIARREIYGGISDFCAAASRFLRFGGTFYIVYRPERLCDLFCALRESGLEPKRAVIVCPDREHDPCLTLVEARKGGSPSLLIPKPLFLYENGEMTPETAYIYENGSMM